MIHDRIRVITGQFPLEENVDEFGGHIPRMENPPRVRIRPLGGTPGCLVMILVSVVASIVLTVVVNVVLRAL